jgi:hypothetical protein
VDKNQRRSVGSAAVFLVVDTDGLSQACSRFASQRSTIMPAAAPCPTDVAT